MISLAAPSLRRPALMVFGVTLIAAMVLGAGAPANAAGAPGDADFLGTATDFAVLAGTTLTNIGPTMIAGDLGVYPGSATPGISTGMVSDNIHAGDAVAMLAQADVNEANATLSALPSSVNLTGQDMGGLTLTAATYDFDASTYLSGTLVLDAQGDPDAVFVFRTGSTLITAASSVVQLINGASSCNVFWQVGSSATLGVATVFSGTILANADIIASTAAQVDGRLLAANGQLQLDTNAITRPDCAEATTTVLTATPNPVTVGSDTVLTTTVTGSTPTGTVEFLAGTTSLGTAPVTGGTATLSTSALPVDSHSVTAVYSGDSFNTSSTSDDITVTVAAADDAAGQAELAATGADLGLLGLGGVLLLAGGFLALTTRKRMRA